MSHITNNQLQKSATVVNQYEVGLDRFKGRTNNLVDARHSWWFGENFGCWLLEAIGVRSVEGSGYQIAVVEEGAWG